MPRDQGTERGRDGRDEIERSTDPLADAPWLALGPGRAQRLANLIDPLLAPLSHVGNYAM